MDLKLLKMLCKESKQHHVIFHELLIQLVRCYVLLKMHIFKVTFSFALPSWLLKFPIISFAGVSIQCNLDIKRNVQHRVAHIVYM